MLKSINGLKYVFEVALLLSVLTVSAPAIAASPDGTLFIVPKFDIRQSSRTEVRIVNNGESDLKFHYNLVCPGVPNVNQFCAKLDRTVALTPHETKVIDIAGQNPPCNQGFLIGYPINEGRQAISKNVLNGSYSISNGRSTAADNAITIRSVKNPGEVLGGPSGFSFNAGPGQDFESVRPLFLSDFKASDNTVAEDVHTRLVVLDISSALGMQNPTSSVAVDFWSSSEVPFSSSFEFICWADLPIESIDQNFLAENLGTGYGSLTLTPQLSCPIPGGCPPLRQSAPFLIGVIEEDNSATIRELSSIPCDDNDPTTTDYFDKNSGCQAFSQCSTLNCDDANACTIDSCDESVSACVHKVISCNDNNPCTIDTCDAVQGCRHTGISCNDNNACTRDSCDVSSGKCENILISCTDGNACTVDLCDATVGCKFLAAVCDDDDICTTQSCSPTQGCIFSSIPNCDGA